MEKKDFKIGQIVYLKIVEGSNAARRINKSNTEEWIKEKIVTKIGNKFISVANADDDRYGEEKFDMTNNFSHYYTCGGQDYELYLSREDILNDIQSEKLYSEIQSKFSGWKNKRKYSLEQLQSIAQIINS
jgi:hypothetical protein